MKVKATKTVSFPQFAWGIHAGEERELPSDKKVQEVILAHTDIEGVGKLGGETRREVVQKESKLSDEKKINK